MTLETTVNRKDYTGDGSSTVFSFPYLFPADGDLDVYIYDTVALTNTQQTITTHYTVDGAGDDAGGNVTMVTAPTATQELIIIRVVDITQSSDYEDYNRFPANTVEGNLDRLTMICQQLQEQFDRSIFFDVNVSGVDTILPAPTANAILGYTSDATAFENKILGATDFTFPASGIVVSDGTNSLIGRSVTGTGSVTITNGNGVAGDIDVDLTTTDANIALKVATADLASTDNAKGASLVGVEDSAGLFTGTDVEAVLAELKGLSVLTENATSTSTRSTTASSGAVNYPHGLANTTTPRKVHVFAKKTGLNYYVSMGVVSIVEDGAIKQVATYQDDTSLDYVHDSDACVGYASDDTTNKQVGKVTSVDDTNIQITWTKTGSPTAGTMDLLFLAEG